MDITVFSLLVSATGAALCWMYLALARREREAREEAQHLEALSEAHRRSILESRRTPEPLDRDGRPHYVPWYHQPETIAARRKRLLDDPTLDQDIMAHWTTLKPFDE